MPVPSRYAEVIKEGKLVKLYVKEGSFRPAGEIGSIFEDSFEFLEITNPYEHFSNISDPPAFRKHLIKFDEIENVTSYLDF